jgi:hypothetical protein
MSLCQEPEMTGITICRRKTSICYNRSIRFSLVRSEITNSRAAFRIYPEYNHVNFPPGNLKLVEKRIASSKKQNLQVIKVL